MASSLPAWSETNRLMLERIGPLALARLEKILETGSAREALQAAKMILDRVVPEPKVDSAAASRQQQIGGSGNAHFMLVLDKARARSAEQIEQIEVEVEAELEPDDV